MLSKHVLEAVSPTSIIDFSFFFFLQLSAAPYFFVMIMKPYLSTARTAQAVNSKQSQFHIFKNSEMKTKGPKEFCIIFARCR